MNQETIFHADGVPSNRGVSKMTKIILVEDHEVVREGVRTLLEAEDEFTVIGEADSGLGVADLVKSLKPDVLIVDLMIPGLNGLEVARQVSKQAPQVRIIILSMHADESYVLQALSNGAVGYVLKDASATELMKAIRETMDGRHYLSPPLSERAIEVYVQKAQEVAVDPYASLTNREREVLHLAHGW
jgi:two-component system, NarL family, response regulator NreC